MDGRINHASCQNYCISSWREILFRMALLHCYQPVDKSSGAQSIILSRARLDGWRWESSQHQRGPRPIWAVIYSIRVKSLWSFLNASSSLAYFFGSWKGSFQRRSISIRHRRQRRPRTFFLRLVSSQGRAVILVDMIHVPLWWLMYYMSSHSQWTWFWSASFTCGDIHKSGDFLSHSRGESDLVTCTDWDGPFPRIATKWWLLEAVSVDNYCITAHYATNGLKLKWRTFQATPSAAANCIWYQTRCLYGIPSDTVAGQRAIKGGIVCVHACLPEKGIGIRLVQCFVLCGSEELNGSHVTRNRWTIFAPKVLGRTVFPSVILQFS